MVRLANTNINNRGVFTISNFKIKTSEIIKYLKLGGIPIITGFQGLNSENRVTTLGQEAQMQVQLCVLNF